MKLDPKQIPVILIITTFFWALLYPFSKLITGIASPVNITLFRFLFGAATIFIFLSWNKKSIKLEKKDFAPVCLITMIGFGVTTLLVFIGLQFTTSTNSSIIVNFNPVLIALLAPFIINEKNSKKQILGILIAFVGVLLVIGNGLPLDQLLSSKNFYGNIITLLACIGTALGTIYLKKYVEKYGGMLTTFYWLLSSAVLMLLISLVIGQITELFSYSAFTWLILLYLGIVTAGICWMIWASTIKYIGATKASSYRLLVPIYATIVSILLLGEMPSPIVIGGGVVMLVGMYILHEPQPI